MIQLLKNEEQFNALIESQSEFIIFKHSTRCSISNRGCQEVYNTIDALKLNNIFLIDVLNQKQLATYISAQSTIHHESPQIIFFNKGKAYAHGSHGQINERNIRHILGGGGLVNSFAPLTY